MKKKDGIPCMPFMLSEYTLRNIFFLCYTEYTELYCTQCVFLNTIYKKKIIFYKWILQHTGTTGMQYAFQERYR